MSSLLLRVRARPDPWLAGLLFVLTLAEAAFADASVAERAATVGPAALMATALLVRRAQPVPAVALATAAIGVASLLAYDVWNSLNVIYIGLLWITYSMAAHESGRRFAAGIGVALLGVAVITVAFSEKFAEQELLVSMLLGTLLFVVAPVFAGRLLSSRLRLNAVLSAKADRIAADRAERAEAAAAAERARIAGELHDVVAHALGAMTIQAAAARRLAATKPERAAVAFEAIEVTGREALGELRTLLDVLKEDGEHEPLHAPQPSLDGLGELARRARAAGLEVRLDVSGNRPAALPASIDLTAYRVVQEALDAALHHGAAGRARVVVRYRGERLEVEVVDDGIRAADRRLLGLRERVGLYGGEVAAGAERSGGHAVRAWLPLEGVAA